MSEAGDSVITERARGRQTEQTSSPPPPPPPQVDGDDEGSAVPDSETSCRGEDITINLTPTNAYEFGQALSAARCSGNVAACAELLGATSPEKLPQLLSTQLDGHTVSFLMQALDSHLLQKDPDLVYQHLRHLHTAERFSVSSPAERANVGTIRSSTRRGEDK